MSSHDIVGYAVSGEDLVQFTAIMVKMVFWLKLISVILTYWIQMSHWILLKSVFASTLLSGLNFSLVSVSLHTIQ